MMFYTTKQVEAMKQLLRNAHKPARPFSKEYWNGECGAECPGCEVAAILNEGKPE